MTDIDTTEDPETGHLYGCASQSFPDPGTCFCNEREAEAVGVDLDDDIWMGLAEGEER